MLSPPGSPRGQLLEKFVRARIVDMTGIDVGLYDFDHHNSIYFFIVSPDEQIYLRYGGRNAESVDAYLDLASLELALELGLARHERWRAGALPKTPRPPPFYAREIQSLREREMSRGRCVECHMIGDYLAAEAEASGTLDKPRDMFRSPEIETIGIELDVPRGLVVARSEGAAQAAGLAAGDRIVAVERTSVLTFGDLQYAYDRLDRAATRLALTVERQTREGASSRIDLSLRLPPLWWVSDLSFRRWSIEPVTHFESAPLSRERKAALGLLQDGIACEVTRVGRRASALGAHTLREGDVIYAVDGTERDDVASGCELHIQLRVRAGSSVVLGVLRDGRRMETTLRTQRHHFRRSP